MHQSAPKPLRLILLIWVLHDIKTIYQVLNEIEADNQPNSSKVSAKWFIKIFIYSFSRIFQILKHNFGDIWDQHEVSYD